LHGPVVRVYFSFPPAHIPLMAALPYPALHASHAGSWLAAPDGDVRPLGRGEAIRVAADTPVILLNAPLVGQRLGHPEISGLDLLELFAFIHPTRFMVPTPKGLAAALGIAPADNEADVARLLIAAAGRLLATLPDPAWPEREGAWDMAQALGRAGWPWAPTVNAALRRPVKGEPLLFARLPKWEDAPPRAQPRTVALREDAVLAQLATLTGGDAERRDGQRAMAAAVAPIFAPPARKGAPNLLLAEAGTGIGKTLAYLAPASLWAAESDGSVQISTFTKALQRQLAQETRRLFPDQAEHRTKVAVRKGRENYLCLLNLEDAMQGGFQGRAAVLAQLVARWAAYSRDGDMVGGDLPGWLPTLFRRSGATALTDRRGECVYAGCPHYRSCFIERSARAAQAAEIVIANHALVMVNAVRRREGESRATRLIFDEGHHLFDAADAMFAAVLSGQEAIELRRWIIGPEGRSRGRRRGLAARLSDISSYDEEGATAISAAAHAAQSLPSDAWLARVQEGAPLGPVEALLAAVRSTVHSRDAASDSGQGDAGYGLETELAEPDGPLVAAAGEAAIAIDAIGRALAKLAERLRLILDDAPDWLDSTARARIDGALASLEWRRELTVAWLGLLARIGGPGDPRFVDWLAVDRIDGREVDIGLHRRWLDPAEPFAATVLEPAQSVLITSATLTGGDWPRADSRSGAARLDGPVRHFAADSPFNYAEAAEVLVVTDVKRGDIPALAAAYGRLIEASGGGTLGLFTAIRRLRAVHARIADRLARGGLPLYAQHVDPIDTGTLVDIFRDDPHASLLGTDALRDGVDVPGDSLRLVVMEGVPWPKPSVLHAARRLAMGGGAYDDFIVRTRLAQAFGRLIRRQGDRGRFVLLSAAVPSRLLSAFPSGTPVRRVTLEDAIARVAADAARQQRFPAPAFSAMPDGK
jgi:ATP-dependent DNA helicase DinG